MKKKKEKEKEKEPTLTMFTISLSFPSDFGGLKTPAENIEWTSLSIAGPTLRFSFAEVGNQATKFSSSHNLSISSLVTALVLRSYYSSNNNKSVTTIFMIQSSLQGK
jgi:hypothetical protein